MRVPGLLLLCTVLWASPEESKRSGETARKSEPSSRQTSITGCLDQRGEAYVLRSTENMRRVMTLKAKGFSADNFARYIGQQVKVRGTVSRDGNFEVIKIEKVAEACSQ